MTEWSRRALLTSGGSFAALGGYASARADEAEPSNKLYFDDLQRFEMHISAMPPQEAVAAYLATPSAGLTAYMRTYRITPDAYLQRLAERPRFYRSIVGLRERLRPYETAITQAMVRVRAFLPGTPEVPVFFLVGTLGPGATPREVRRGADATSLGILMPAEHLAMTVDTDMSEFPEGRAGRANVGDVTGFVSHEYGHVAQVHLQGLARYRELYTIPGNATNLAMAIREGGADYISWLATGQRRERHRYFDAHARTLGREFVAIAHLPAADFRGWFSGVDSNNPGRPAQIGYAVGFDICRHFMDAAADRSAALLAIASASEAKDFLAIASAYLAEQGSVKS
ncbi:hypothetical protein [Sphingopyxis kveilinensis]|uniref:hypothetical protein n=1 Tax=Sphingopyxis kveilinensis TaxID=3114367 RepID=UPI0030D57647